MWTYNSANGNLSQNGTLVGQGYAGHGAGLDNQADQYVRDLGPLPVGSWTIGDFFDDPIPDPPDGRIHLGPCVAPLTPNPGTETEGRGGFFIHGDNAEQNHTASDGCLVLGSVIRQQIKDSGDNQLEVV